MLRREPYNIPKQEILDMNLREVSDLLSGDDGEQTFSSEAAMLRNREKMVEQRKRIVQNLMHGRECSYGE